MIFDSVSNAHLYYGMHPDIKTGLEYTSSLTSEVSLGEYQVNENVKCIVSEYETKAVFERGYEAHKYVIDIQYPIIGRERIKFSGLLGMEENIPYEAAKDRTFYKKPIQENQVDIGNGYFAIFFPEDAHCPQLYVEEPELIKKVTMKVKMF